MAEYRFRSTWLIDAEIELVWEALDAAEHWPSWWRGVRSVALVRAGAAGRVGEIRRTTWRSRLPYDLTFDFRVTHAERPHLLEGVASGDLVGTGRWRLFTGPPTAVVYEWRVRTTRPWMNVLTPLARPLFVRNHDWLMRQGGIGLAARLGVALLALD